MTRSRRLLLGVVAAVGFTALGAVGAVVALRIGGGSPSRPSDTVAAPPRGDVAAAVPLPSPGAGAVDAEVEIVLSPEAVARAGSRRRR